MKRKILNRIYTIDNRLILLLIFAFVFLFIYDLLLINIKTHSEFSISFGKLFYSICLSYITSFIFYFFIVHIPHERKILNNIIFLHNKTFLLENEGLKLCCNIIESNSEKFDISKVYTSDKIEKALLNINPFKKVDSDTFQANSFNNWFEYLDNLKRTVDTITTQLFIHSNILKDNHLKTIFVINDAVNLFDKTSYDEEFLKQLTKSIIRFTEHTNILKSIFDKDYKYYREERII
ncbi:MAG: hypothetical protein WCH34_07230 [Bacteroidota bacterium]